MTSIDIGIFAHNEARAIQNLLRDLSKQSIWADHSIDARVVVLANGCADDTAERARATRAGLDETIAGRIEIVELERGGKSRTWNHFTHVAARKDAELLVFMDADIGLVQPGALSRMVAALTERPELVAFNSRPVKDITYHRLKVGPVASVIERGGGTLYGDLKNGVTGSLYVLRATVARDISLPIGLPVEDGFVGLMVLSNLVVGPWRYDRIDADEDVFHVYESIRTIGALVRHQTRIVIGGVINDVLLEHMRKEIRKYDHARRYLQDAARDEGWVTDRVREYLPRAPYGYVSFKWLFWRLRAAIRARHWASVMGVLMMGLGFAFDAVVYIDASIKMARGVDEGYW